MKHSSDAATPVACATHAALELRPAGAKLDEYWVVGALAITTMHAAARADCLPLVDEPTLIVSPPLRRFLCWWG